MAKRTGESVKRRPTWRVENGGIGIHRNLLRDEEFAAIGPYAGSAYVWMLLSAKDPAAAEPRIYAPAWKVADRTGMSERQARAAIKTLIPRFVGPTEDADWYTLPKSRAPGVRKRSASGE